MRLVTFEQSGARFVGALVGDDVVVNLTEAGLAAGHDPAWFRSMQDLIEAGDDALAAARDLVDRGDHAVPLADVRLLAPLPRPQSIRDFFTFPIHIRQSRTGMLRLGARLAGQPVPTEPPAEEIPPLYRDKAIYHKGNPLTVVGPDAEIVWPRYSQVMDFELELAIIIGRKGVDIPASEAAAHIFGYTIFNDLSARDAQMEEMPGLMGPAKGKDFDGSNAIGPCIATPDEFADVHDIRMSASVNGEVWTEGSNSEMLHRFEDIIAYASRSETLYPGELIGSGTMSNGCGLELDRFLEDGDEVTLSIEGIGELTNRVRRPG